MATLEYLQPRVIVTGMALGWDQSIARACVRLNFSFVAAIPFEGQEHKWPDEQQTEYHRLLKRATYTEVISPGAYSNEKFKTRNRWIVVNSEGLVALWSGNDKSGTGHCVRYAQSRGTPVLNVWGSWEKFR